MINCYCSRVVLKAGENATTFLPEAQNALLNLSGKTASSHQSIGAVGGQFLFLS